MNKCFDELERKKTRFLLEFVRILYMLSSKRLGAQWPHAHSPPHTPMFGFIGFINKGILSVSRSRGSGHGATEPPNVLN